MLIMLGEMAFAIREVGVADGTKEFTKWVNETVYKNTTQIIFSKSKAIVNGPQGNLHTL